MVGKTHKRLQQKAAKLAQQREAAQQDYTQISLTKGKGLFGCRLDIRNDGYFLKGIFILINIGTFILTQDDDRWLLSWQSGKPVIEWKKKSFGHYIYDWGEFEDLCEKVWFGHPDNMHHRELLVSNVPIEFTSPIEPKYY